MNVAAPALEGRARRRQIRLLRSWSGRIGLGVIVLVLALAGVGPFIAPQDPEALLGIPYSTPSAEYPLGTDFLGRDVLSRVLHGGWTLIALAVVSTAFAYVIGGSLGLFAGFTRTIASGIVMRATDVMLAFPYLLVLLLLAAGLGSGAKTLLIGLTFAHVPSIIRIIQAATLDSSVRGYVEAAIARGEAMRHILFREILPNISSTIAADLGPRLTISILAIAGFNFLGLGLQPPISDWGLMINENRPGIELTPWPIVVPAVLIAVLTIAVNVVADTIARNLGTSIEEELLRR